MANEKGMTKAPSERADFAVTGKVGAAVIDSIVLRGDLSGLAAGDRTKFYIQMCEGLGLNPHAQPFAFLRLNGKEVLYATRGATDQLAAMHRVNRRIVDGPKVIDCAGTKMVYAVCEASLPNGRVETSTATLPVGDPINMLMKTETKAKRRATLSILGLGVLDELEVETIPASALERVSQVDFAAVDHRVEDDPRKVEEAVIEEPQAFYARLQEIELPGESVAVWLKWRAELAALPVADREAAWRALCKRTEEVGRMKNAKVWLKKAIAEEDARRSTANGMDSYPVGRQREPGDDDDDPTPGGSGGGVGGGRSTKANGSGAAASKGGGPVGLVEPWMTSTHGVDTYLETKTAWPALENAVRARARTVPQGALRMYFLRRAAERLQALSEDTLGTVLAMEGPHGCRATVMAWADEGPKKAKAQQAAAATVKLAAGA